MKVLCIDTKPRGSLYDDSLKRLKEGHDYTAIHIRPNERGVNVILLEEIKSSHPSKKFIADRFIPLSEIDETTFERDYNKELI